MKRFDCLAALCLFSSSSFAWAEEPAARFARGIESLASIFDAAPAERAEWRTTLECVRSEGLPKELKEAKLDLAIAAPDRLRLGTKIKGDAIELGRLGDEVWIWQASKSFAVVGTPGVVRFSADAESIDHTSLGALGLPVDRDFLKRLPKLFRVEAGGVREIEGAPCHELIATPRPEAAEALGLAGIVLKLTVRESDSLPVRIAVKAGKVDAEVALHHLRKSPLGPEDDWRLPAAVAEKAERVAVSHLTRFIGAGIAAVQAKTPPLGAVKGERRLVATHGQGRLEDHDGTRVLFLRGTPEEMGEQQGRLLGEEIRQVVERVLYGVGVGSSFEKGKWFFGTIEECVRRLSPFIDGRTLREMDAIALATGLHPQEVRLANFFPELFHCSGFALMGSATAKGRIFHGRILDYMKGVGLEANAVVTVVRPDEGHAWVNIGYAGFTGSVTAMNEHHISIGEMGGRGEGDWDGKPMAQLVREVMEKASTLEEAIEIMRKGPRTCEYYYVIADGKAGSAAGIKATPTVFDVVRPGEAHPQLDTPVKDTVLLSAGDRYTELVRRVEAGFGEFNAQRARDLMTRPVCMSSNIQSVLFAPDTLDFWVANADSENVASHARYTKYNLRALLDGPPAEAAE
jgi:hypothetical protein